MFFICLTVCAQDYHEYLKLVCFSCLWVSMVACHPASIRPCTGAARTATFRGNKCIWDKFWPWWAHQIQLVSLERVTFLASLSGLYRSCRIPVVWFAALGCGHSWPSLNCQSVGLIRLVSTFSQVGSVPTSAKESIGGGWMDLQLTMDQTWIMQVQLFLNFLAWAFAPELIQSFS